MVVVVSCLDSLYLYKPEIERVVLSALKSLFLRDSLTVLILVLNSPSAAVIAVSVRNKNQIRRCIVCAACERVNVNDLALLGNYPQTCVPELHKRRSVFVDS